MKDSDEETSHESGEPSGPLETKRFVIRPLTSVQCPFEHLSESWQGDSEKTITFIFPSRGELSLIASNVR